MSTLQGPPTAAQELLEFWFGEGSAVSQNLSDRVALWFGKRPDDDRRVRIRFGDWLRRAGEGEFDAWAQTARGLLALIVLCDQIPRVLHRESAVAFERDAKNLELVQRGRERGVDRELDPIESVFFYMPYMHSEQRAMQEESVALYSSLTAPERSAQELLGEVAKYARMHREIIERFGRFPHRNQALGRTSTPSELELLKQPNSSF